MTYRNRFGSLLQSNDHLPRKEESEHSINFAAPAKSAKIVFSGNSYRNSQSVLEDLTFSTGGEVWKTSLEDLSNIVTMIKHSWFSPVS